MSDSHPHSPPAGREPLPPSAIERHAGAIQKAVVGVCVLLVVGDVIFNAVGHRHTHFAFEGWVGIYGVIGFVSYVGLVMSAKLLRRALMRPEDYYERLAEKVAPEPVAEPAPEAMVESPPEQPEPEQPEPEQPEPEAEAHDPEAHS